MLDSDAFSLNRYIQCTWHTRIPSDQPGGVLSQREVAVVKPTGRYGIFERLLLLLHHTEENGHRRYDKLIVHLLSETGEVRRFPRECGSHQSHSQNI